ncbi:acetyl-CoA acetyltransferase [Desulfatibacillum aliphaticivorans]|uniref:acetyl-CoA acetyltransferase n=1 Tax=Desulfatibacillum aliphaticivorans TaxID=218208 RepID=UPI000407AACC|nr:acetyl-CoA acetyltransferase [Desulfatibacillum aliphaticivorans]
MPHVPVIVGISQLTQFPELEKPLDPMRLMADAARAALADAGPPALASLVDCIWVSNILSWGYKDAPGLLSANLGLKPSHNHYGIMSGHVPQWFVNQAARRIASGQSRAVLMAGAEAQHSVRQSYKDAVKLNWPARENPEIIGDGASPDLGTNSLENSHQLMIPVNMYALFETAIRAAKGREPKEHQAFLGRLFEKFSAAAAKNPLAWNRRKYTAEEIATPGPDNPAACEPYTRRMCAAMNVDMAAAVVMTSEETAKKMGVNSSQLVYPMGGADLNNIRYVTQRPKLNDSPALDHCIKRALDQAGLGVSQIRAFDLYSCFPSMVEIAMEALGLDPEDPRPLTVTGGLPFFGGPMGNYSMHAIAEATAQIRTGKLDNVMVAANGGFNTRHSVGVYGREPSPKGWSRDDSAIQESILSAALPEPVKEAAGRLVVDGCIVRNTREGVPEKGLVLGTLEDGRKTLAVLDVEPALLGQFCNKELVGGAGAVRFDSNSGCNMFVPEL